jgi:hypothetical protein
LSVIDSWSPDQSVWSNAALTIVMAFLLGDGPAPAGTTFQDALVRWYRPPAKDASPVDGPFTDPPARRA